jgi:hypothetical protein
MLRLQSPGTIMPTDVAMLLMRKAEAEARTLRDQQNDLILVCLWAALGLVLTAVMFDRGFDPLLVPLLVNG